MRGLVDVGEGVGETRRRPARNLGEKERALFNISPVVLDEYLERKSVDAVLRQEREKETEETDPFL